MIELKCVSFQYDNGTQSGGLHNISLHIGKGEIVLLCGESGCGKTTLTRLINGLIPHYFEGSISGEVRICGKNAAKMPLHEIAEHVGSVFQNPRSQFFCVDTNSELAFGCENQGLPANEIVTRIEETVSHLHIEKLMKRSIFSLSGGEKQKIACGCVHAAAPEIIVLDEPSSNLDAQTTNDLAQIMKHWKDEGKTIVIAEHRLYYLRDIADRMILMRNGAIEREFTLEQAKKLTADQLASMGLRPLMLESLAVPTQTKCPAHEHIELSDFCFSYENGRKAIDFDALSLPKGRTIAVIGQNGAGKSTFARCLCGLNRRFDGKVHIDGRVCRKKQCLKQAYMVMQDVNHQLFTENVLDEVLLSMEEQNTEKAEAILDSLNLLALKNQHPMSLSGGQKQRVAIAGAIASERVLIVFDEPTSGLDLRHMEKVSSTLKQLKAIGKTLVIVSHDMELIVRTCDYVIHVENGTVKDVYYLNDMGIDLLKSFFSDTGRGSKEGRGVS